MLESELCALQRRLKRAGWSGLLHAGIRTRPVRKGTQAVSFDGLQGAGLCAEERRELCVSAGVGIIWKSHLQVVPLDESLTDFAFFRSGDVIALCLRRHAP